MEDNRWWCKFGVKFTLQIDQTSSSTNIPQGNKYVSIADAKMLLICHGVVIYGRQ